MKGALLIAEGFEKGVYGAFKNTEIWLMKIYNV